MTAGHTEEEKKTFQRRLVIASPTPDVSSTEWVAEAPSACAPAGHCTVLPMANFGGVTFVVGKAIASAHAGTISDPAWSATAITLGDPDSGSTNATPTRCRRTAPRSASRGSSHNPFRRRFGGFDVRAAAKGRGQALAQLRADFVTGLLPARAHISR
jgi:hypothetical protein